MSGKGADLPLEAPDSSREQGHALCYAGVGNGKARGKIVGPVEHEVRPDHEVGCIGYRDPPVADLHVQFGIEAGYPTLGDNRLAMTDVAFVEQGLALEIAGIDTVVIDQGQFPDPRTGEILQGRAADTAKSDQHEMLFREGDLPRTADFRQDDVARKAIEAFR